MLEENKIYLGDCLEVMNDIDDNSIDMVLCDLPYGYTELTWDKIIPMKKLWKQYKRIIIDNGAIILFGKQPFTSQLISSNYKMFRYQWIWKSNNAANFAQSPYMPLIYIEDINVFSKGTATKNSKIRMKYYPQGLQDIYKICKGKQESFGFRQGRKPQKNYIQTKTGYPNSFLEFKKDNPKLHTTQKPVALLEYLIKTYTQKHELVLDNCIGSGSTAIACINTKRNFIGIEKEEEYFEIAKNRTDKHLKERIGDN